MVRTGQMEQGVDVAVCFEGVDTPEIVCTRGYTEINFPENAARKLIKVLLAHFEDIDNDPHSSTNKKLKRHELAGHMGDTE